MEIKEVIIGSIKTSLFSLKIDDSKIKEIGLEHPEEFSNGDYSSNVAMVLSKQLAKNPREIAQSIVTEINKNLPKEIEKVEVAGPGFINFYLSKDFFENKTKEIISEKENFGRNKKLEGKKIIVEYTDTNAFKQFHIGHLMSNTIGESISRIVQNGSAEIKRITYGGDIGLHVAKTIWGIKYIEKVYLKDKETHLFNINGKEVEVYIPKDTDSLDYKMYFLGAAYYTGASFYEDNPEFNAEIQNLNKKIFDLFYFDKSSSDEEDRYILKWYKWGKEVSIEHFEEIYKILDTKFDRMIWESEVAKDSLSIIDEALKKNIFQKSEGAIIFKGEDYGLHTRVFINSKGVPTYEAKDLGVAKKKDDLFRPDRSIIITGNEQNEYFKVMLKALSLIYPDIAEKTKHIPHGMLRLPTGKMGSRTGNVITGLSLINDIKVKVIEKMSDREMDKKEQEKVSEEVAVGALKYSILKQTTGKDIIFDFDKSLSFEGDSGPYLQYSYARARSILRKAKEEKIQMNIEYGMLNIESNNLEKMLYRFSEIVEWAGDEYSPHHIASYLIELSSTFNGFYAKGKIVDKDDIKSPYKIALTEAFSIIIKNGLNLLGISAPEKM